MIELKDFRKKSYVKEFKKEFFLICLMNYLTQLDMYVDNLLILYMHSFF